MKSRYTPQRVRRVSPRVRSTHHVRDRCELRLGHISADAGVRSRNRVRHLSPGRDPLPTAARDRRAMPECRQGRDGRTDSQRSGRAAVIGSSRAQVTGLIRAAEEILRRGAAVRQNLSTEPALSFESLPLNLIFVISYSGDVESRPGRCRRCGDPKKNIDPKCKSVYIQFCHPQLQSVVFRCLRAHSPVFRIKLSEGSLVGALVRMVLRRSGKVGRRVPRTAIEVLERVLAPFRFVQL
jgi:hypothetical protein